jgi:hypothetical protein
MRERMIDALAREALDVGLDAMCAHVQDHMGIDDGGIASMVFAADPALDALRELLIRYIELELENKE